MSWSSPLGNPVTFTGEKISKGPLVTPCQKHSIATDLTQTCTVELVQSAQTDVCVYFRVQMLDLSVTIVGNSSSSGVLYKLPAHLTPRMDRHVLFRV